MDVREIAIWHRGAKLLIIERAIRNLYHMRVAQFAEHKAYEKEIERLEERRKSLVDGDIVKAPKTPEECKQARIAFAQSLGLKRIDKKTEVKDGRI